MKRTELDFWAPHSSRAAQHSALVAFIDAMIRDSGSDWAALCPENLDSFGSTLQFGTTARAQLLDWLATALNQSEYSVLEGVIRLSEGTELRLFSGDDTDRTGEEDSFDHGSVRVDTAMSPGRLTRLSRDAGLRVDTANRRRSTYSTPGGLAVARFDLLKQLRGYGDYDVPRHGPLQEIAADGGVLGLLKWLSAALSARSARVMLPTGGGDTGRGGPRRTTWVSEAEGADSRGSGGPSKRIFPTSGQL